MNQQPPPIVSAVIVTLPTGQRLALRGLRARLIRAIAVDCTYLDAEGYDFGRLEAIWAPNAKIKLQATRFHKERAE